MKLRNNDKDWLLTVSKVMLILAEIAFVFSLIAIVIGIVGFITFGRDRVMADLVAAGAPDGTYLAIIAVLVLIWLSLSLSMLFVRQLRAIVESVHQGDPFEPVNASRLTRMGWYALGIQACQFMIEPFVTTYGEYAQAIGSGRFGMGSDASLTGVAMAVTLFILARVFRQGAAMREELEGTV